MIGMKQAILITLLAFSTVSLNTAKATNHEVGDMQYWDGVQWTRIPVIKAPKGSTPTLALCEGVPTWVLNKCLSKGPYQIGGLGPARGIVFYLSDSSGLHGLEAAPVDQSSKSQWGCYGANISITSGTAIGSGAANTAKIITHCKHSDAEFAAALAKEYVFHGFSDWYLPSLDELNEMLSTIGPGASAPLTDLGGFANAHYWSSTGDGYSNARGSSFSNGTVYSPSYTTNTTMFVRAIRSF